MPDKDAQDSSKAAEAMGPVVQEAKSTLRGNPESGGIKSPFQSQLESNAPNLKACKANGCEARCAARAMSYGITRSIAGAFAAQMVLASIVGGARLKSRKVSPNCVEGS